MNEEPTVTKRCSLCEKHKPTTDYYRHRLTKDGLGPYCKPCHNEKQSKWIVENPKLVIFTTKKTKAKKNGIEFNLAFADMVWPTHCPALGIELDYSRFRGKGNTSLPNSPSFDRIDPSKGYVTGNVIIVSNLANMIKSNATVEELKRVATFYEQLIPINQHGDYSNA